MQLPASLLQSLNNIKGFDEAAFKAVHASGEQVTSIRLNPAKAVNRQPSIVNRQPLPANSPLDSYRVTTHYSQIPWCTYGYYLSSRPSFTLDPTFHAGAYYVQEASSMFLWHALQQTIGEATKDLRVLDLCAAPGGKSTLLASYFKDGLVVSNEVIKSRASILVENITKWGSNNVIVTNNDPSHFQSLTNFFDVIVVDAPCSGSGLFRKDNEAISEWSENNVNLCSHRQQRIIADVLPALKEGGILIYSTCSYSKQEDEDILDELSEKHGLLSIQLQLNKDWNIVETQSDSKQAYGYRFYPNLLRGEGFFIAALQKNSGGSTSFLAEQNLTKLSKNESLVIQDFAGILDGFSLFKQGESIKAIQQQWLPSLQIIAKQLYIKKAGTELGTIKGKDVIPHHEFALSTLPTQHFNSAEVDETNALQYLKRKDMELDAAKGWCLVRHCGLNLGWVKVLPNRINNYYPQEWRILKG